MIESQYTKVTFNDVISTMYQGINTAADKVAYVSSGMPIIQSKHFTSGRLILEETKFLSTNDVEKYGKKYIPEKGDILFSNIGTVGKSTVVDNDLDFMFAWNVFLMKPKAELLFNRYLQYYLDYLLERKVYERWFTGGTVKFLNKKTISKLEIPLPTLPEQKKIAEILDAADSLRQKDQQLIEHYNTLSQSLFLDMFGDPVTNPMRWEETLLESLFSDKPRIGTTTPATSNGKIKVVRVGEIGKKEINLHKCKNVNLNESEKVRYLLSDGDIVLARAIGSKDHLGKASLFKNQKFPVVFDSHVMRLRFKQDLLDPLFFYHWLESKGGRAIFLNNAGQTAVQFNVNAKQMSRIKIKKPPLELQKKFAGLIQAIEKQKQHAQASLQKSEDLFNSLLQKAFKGELTH